MSAKEKPVHGGNRERAEERAALTGAALFQEQFTTAADGRQQGFVEALLPQGEANAIPTADLVRLAGYRSARDLQKEIERERRHGALILSRSGGRGGYFVPSSGETGRREITAYMQTLRARAINTLCTIKSARAALAVIDGQTRMEV